MKLKEITPELQTWIDSRPDVVKAVMTKYHPYATYRLAQNNQLCVIESVNEDGKVRIVVFDEITMMFSHSVFGIDPADLTECDVSDQIKSIMLEYSL